MKPPGAYMYATAGVATRKQCVASQPKWGCGQLSLHVAAISQLSVGFATLDTTMLRIFAVGVMLQHNFPHTYIAHFPSIPPLFELLMPAHGMPPYLLFDMWHAC